MIFRRLRAKGYIKYVNLFLDEMKDTKALIENKTFSLELVEALKLDMSVCVDLRNRYVEKFLDVAAPEDYAGVSHLDTMKVSCDYTHTANGVFVDFVYS
jgi:hypothetical protein